MKFDRKNLAQPRWRQSPTVPSLASYTALPSLRKPRKLALGNTQK
jgi:hypothetical protein